MRGTEVSGIWRREGACVFRVWQGSVLFENGLSVKIGMEKEAMVKRLILIVSDFVEGAPVGMEKVTTF